MNPVWRSGIITAAMVAMALGAYLLTPGQRVPSRSVDLEQLIPHQFGDWSEQASSTVLVSPEVEQSSETSARRPAYDQVLMRTYRNSTDGAEVMLALAYGRTQRQEFKIHRPELCYYGQGYEVTPGGARVMQLEPGRRVQAQTMTARNQSRLELVSYWIRIGDLVSTNAWQTRWIILREGLDGRIPDGLLVRASSVMQTEADSGRAFEAQRRFLTAMYGALSMQGRKTLAGTSHT